MDFEKKAVDVLDFLERFDDPQWDVNDGGQLNHDPGAVQYVAKELRQSHRDALEGLRTRVERHRELAETHYLATEDSELEANYSGRNDALVDVLSWIDDLLETKGTGSDG